MSNYIYAIVIPVPRANLDTYKRMSAEWGSAHVRRGALYYSDSISDDVQPDGPLEDAVRRQAHVLGWL